MTDPLHLFFGFRPNQSFSDLMRLVKGESSECLPAQPLRQTGINKQGFTDCLFRWQSGYGAFSYSRSQIKVVAYYVENQEKHHRKKTFLQEYREFLNTFEVGYDQQYIFKPLE